MYCGGGHLGFPIGIKNIKFVEDLPMIIPGQFGFNCSSGFREEAFSNISPIGSNVVKYTLIYNIYTIQFFRAVMVLGFTTAYAIVPITTGVVSSNLD